MSEIALSAYQIVAVHRDGTAQRGKINIGKPLTIGSGPTADLRLTSSAILPTHVRLKVTNRNNLELLNLGKSSSVSLNGVPITTLETVTCKSGDTIELGDYTLSLQSEPDRDINDDNIRRSAQSSPSRRTSETQLPTWRPAREDSTQKYPFDKRDTDLAPIVIEQPLTLDEDAPTYHLAQPKPAAKNDLALALTVAEDALSTVDQPTALYPVTQGLQRRYVDLDNTQPTAWIAAGFLIAQLTINPVNLAPGERVRIPVSIHNKYSHPVELEIDAIGLPKEWAILSSPRLKLSSGELQGHDLVLQTQSLPTQDGVDIMICMSDVLSQQITLNVPLRIVFKNAPNIVSWLDPAVLHDSGPNFLKLQNHTLTNTTVYLAGGSHSDNVRVVPAQTSVEITPGQTVNIPVNFAVKHRRLWQSTSSEFWISAQQGTRAPLDCVGTVRIQPQVRLSLVATYIAGLGLALITLGCILFSLFQLMKSLG